MKTKKILLYAVLIVSLLLNVFSFNKIHKMNVENDKERELLLNRIYSAVTFLDKDINDILKDDNLKGKDLSKSMENLNYHLEAVTHIFGEGGIVGGDKFYLHYDSGDLNLFNGASITINDKTFNIKAFDEDGKLSKKEIDYLSYLAKKVEKFKNNLSNKNGIEENKNISYEKLNEISNQLFKEEYQIEKLSQ